LFPGCAAIVTMPLFCKILIAMTKDDLAQEVSRVAEISEDDAERMVEAIFERIVQSLNDGNKFEIRGFGTFGIRQHPSREIPNPKTGARVEVAAKQVPYFEPSKALKKFVNSPARVAPPPRTRPRRPPKTT
jgi:nucleoid DNA-binding protein